MEENFLREEKERLEKIAEDSWYSKGVNYYSIKFRAELIKRFITRGVCLELGPAEGIMTERLVDYFTSVTCVEGSLLLSESLKKKFPTATIVTSLFEEFDTDIKFDAIVLGHVLEHVDDPVAILKKYKNFLADDGKIFAACPNARSIHRQAAVIMGLLQNECQLNDTDIHHGHRRVYTPESFRHDFIKAGLKIEYFGGYWLKPLSNSQIEKFFSEEMIEAFLILGERYPDIAAEMYIVARKK